MRTTLTVLPTLLLLALLLWVLASLIRAWRSRPKSQEARERARMISMAGLAGMGGNDFRASKNDLDLLRFEQEVLRLVTLERIRAGCPELAPDGFLLGATRRHSRDFAEMGWFRYLPLWFKGGIYSRGVNERYAKVGELFSRRAVDCSPERSVARWMRRKKTRRILLNPSFSRAAVGVVRRDRDGVFFLDLVLAQPKR